VALELGGGLLELDPPPKLRLRTIGTPAPGDRRLPLWTLALVISRFRVAAICLISAATKTADIRWRTMVLP